MTTIAFKDGILAFDSLLTQGAEKVGHVNKGCKTANHLVAVCGNAAFMDMMFTWAKTGFDPKAKPPKVEVDKDDEMTAVVVDKSGKIVLYTEEMRPIKIRHRQFGHAEGTGAPYARAAMYLGKTAAEAVRVASKFDGHTGGKVSTLSFND